MAGSYQRYTPYPITVYVPIVGTPMGDIEYLSDLVDYADTTNATPVSKGFSGPPSLGYNGMQTVTYDISAIKNDGSAAASWLIRATWRWDSGNTGTLISQTAVATHTEAGSSTWAVTAAIVDVLGSDFLTAQLTGQAATTIRWKVIVHFDGYHSIT